MGSIEETVDVIPTIDLTPWLNDDDSSAAARIAVVKELHDACVTYGFFQLVGHGIPLQLQKRVLSCAANFFDLPLEEKMNVSIKKCMGRANRGYEVLQGQTLQTGALPDLKEGFFIGAEEPSDSPRAGRFLTGPNQWPESIATADFEDPLQAYRAGMVELAQLVLNLLALALPSPAPSSVFDDFMTQPSGNLRLLHYPPKPSPDPEQLGCGAHTDFGGITFVLQQPETKGLEVFYPPKGTWIPVEAKENAFVANVGDLLHLWTGKYYRSAVHRVTDVGDKHRYSAPFFYNGNMDLRFFPLDGSPSMTVEEHILGKLNASRAEQTLEKAKNIDVHRQHVNLVATAAG
ncbi:hypothetical protein PMZ80_004899 [Knufia obscura]|uniref:Fe2OG dioxygenase domain-containing protein n=1 Tax=Knufia obscura TaxID=1635080 RepID=A0ABR0RP20_9EURO|nr:hypothetical protein PMZ80_004899 [Knufia obscura]